MEHLLQEVLTFRDQRNWKRAQLPERAGYIFGLEASELLENFQWKTSEEAVEDKLAEITDELADVLIYALLLSNELGIDLEEAVRRKIKKNAEKYPIDKAYGSNKKYTEL